MLPDKGTWAVVTGASSGLGVDFARLLAARGHGLILTARRQDRLEALAADLVKTHGVPVEVVACDLAEPTGPTCVLERATAQGRQVQILINNAGFGLYGPFEIAEWSRLDQLLRLNVLATTELSWHFVRHMRAHGLPSHVLHVASIGGFQPVPGFAAYAASKAYVRDFSEALTHELRGTNVGVTCLSPGGTWTEFTAVAGYDLSPLARRTMMRSEDVARMGLDAMASGKAQRVTGVLNQLSCFLVRFAPRWVAARAAEVAMASGAPPAARQ